MLAGMQSVATVRYVLFLTPCVLALSLLNACGGGSTVNSTPVAVVASLPAAIANDCIPANAQAQTSMLPAAGGVTGTVSVGALPASSSTCASVTLATGADATLAITNTTTQSAERKTVAAPVVPPLAQIDFSNATNVQLSLTTIKFNVPSSVTPGSYPATIATSYDRGDGILNTTVVNVTVTISSSGEAVISGLTIGQPLTIITPGKQALFTLYQPGTVLPSPSATPSASPTTSQTAAPTASPAASALPSPMMSPTPFRTASPTAAPTVAGAIVGTSLTITPAACAVFGNGPTTLTFTVTAVTNAPPGTIFEYGWASGSGFIETVPPPVTTYNTTEYFGYQFTTSNNITVTSPVFPNGSLVGGNGNLSVILALPPSGFYLDPIAVNNTAGSQLSAHVTLEGGTNTCPPN